MKHLMLAFMTLIAGIFFSNVVFSELFDEGSAHKIVIHIDDNDPKKMNLVLNNASNIYKYYFDKGEEAIIEIVAYGPGLKMFLINSPVKKRLKTISQNFENVSFKACSNTMKKMSKKKGKPVKLDPTVSVTPSGAVHIINRQEQGWAYLRP